MVKKNKKLYKPSSVNSTKKSSFSFIYFSISCFIIIFSIFLYYLYNSNNNIIVNNFNNQSKELLIRKQINNLQLSESSIIINDEIISLYKLIISNKHINKEWWTLNDAKWINDNSYDIPLLHKAMDIYLNSNIEYKKGINIGYKLITEYALSNEQYNRIGDSLTQYLLTNELHNEAIIYLKLILKYRKSNIMVNRWYGFLLQELILIQEFDEAKHISFECINNLSNDLSYFPFFCYHQLGILYSFENNHKLALDTFLEEYNVGISLWRDNNGKSCIKSSHIPILLDNYKDLIHIDNLLFPSLLSALPYSCSLQKYPYIIDSNSNIIKLNNTYQSMKCITEDIKQARMYKLSNITIMGKNKWIINTFNDNGTCILYTFSYPFSNSLSIPRYIGSYSVPYSNLPLKKIHRALIPHFVDYNYYHMSIEVLAEIILTIQQPFFQTNEFVILISPSKISYNLLKMLNLLSYVEVYQWGDYRYQIEEAYYVDWIFTSKDFYSLQDNIYPDAQEYFIPPAPVIYLVKEYIMGILPDSIRYPKQDSIIFIHRDNENYRSISNINDLYNQIEQLSLKHNLNFIIHKGDTSISEQISLFTKAKIIIGVHGAGLTNMIYCQDNTHIIEIPVYPTKVSVYSRLASILNITYWTLLDNEIYFYSKEHILSLQYIDNIINTITVILNQ